MQDMQALQMEQQRCLCNEEICRRQRMASSGPIATATKYLLGMDCQHFAAAPTPPAPETTAQTLTWSRRRVQGSTHWPVSMSASSSNLACSPGSDPSCSRRRLSRS